MSVFYKIDPLFTHSHVASKAAGSVDVVEGYGVPRIVNFIYIHNSRFCPTPPIEKELIANVKSSLSI